MSSSPGVRSGANKTSRRVAGASQDAQKDQNRKALGRGLAALLPPIPTSTVATASAGFRMLPIERIVPNRSQPRKHFEEEALADLAQSIEEQGVLQPLVVRRLDDGYEIVAGERRWRAASRAGLHEVPALVKDYSDSAALQVALVENIQRQDLDPLEEAESFYRLVKDHHLTHDAVAQAVGKSRVAITNSLRLLNLPPEVLAMLADGRLTAGHARALMMLGDKKAMGRLAEDLVGRHASVRDAESRVRQLLQSKRRLAQKHGAGSKEADAASVSAAHSSAEETLQRQLGTRVKLVHQDGKGHIEIHYHSPDALEGLLDRLSRA